MLLTSLLSWYRNLRRQFKILIPALLFLLTFALLLQTNRRARRLVSSFPFPHLLGANSTVYSPYYSQSDARFYQYDTQSLFPPRNRNDAHSSSAALSHNTSATTNYNSSAGLCDGFPQHMLSEVQIVMKTGIGESAKNRAHLKTLTSCISNIIILSDVEEQTERHHYIDVLADLPASYHDDNPDFAFYTKQKEAYEKGETAGMTKEGWRLDRFKFLPMVDRAYAMNPMAKWYVFLEADVYMFWDNLFRFLKQLDPKQMHYLGSAVEGRSGVWFAYGGAGIVMSEALITKITRGGTQKLGAKYESLAKGDCCGDAVLAYMIYDETGVRIDQLYPMFSGDELKGIRANEERWCVPVISLHKVYPELMESLWHWERTRPYDEDPITYSTLFQHALPGLEVSPRKDLWDNFSDEEQDKGSTAHESASACESACFSDPSCLQYSYVEKKCKWMKFAIPGQSNEDKNKKFISGWDVEKLKNFGSPLKGTMNGGCRHTMWPRPKIV